MKLFIKIFIVVLFLISFENIDLIDGHGMLINPPHRGSRWRFDPTAPINWNDNELFCGGKTVQHQVNGGKCGICGDDYRMNLPRPHEIGGVFGQGVITGKFIRGSIINVVARITANHWGFFVFDVCNLDHQKETEQCFDQKVFMPNGEDFVLLTHESRDFDVPLRLPEKLTCDHCVLRWTYHTANSWGMCPNGTGAVGCGIQETFRSCSDITIFNLANDVIDEIPEIPNIDNEI